MKKKDEKTRLKALPKTNNPNTLLESLKREQELHILPVIRYESPDIIVQHIDEDTNESSILFVAEFMTHTPQWQHPAQRFGRIYCASQLKLPVSLVLPRTKIKLERGKADKYKETSYVCSPVIYYLFAKTTILNKTPTLLFHWPDTDGCLKRDKRHPTAPHVEKEILQWFEFLNHAIDLVCALDSDFVRGQLERIRKRQQRTSQSNYDTIKGTFATEKVTSQYKLDVEKLSPNFLTNEETLVFEPTGLAPPSSYFRTDPYAGMLCAFDNMFCREEKGERSTNLLLRARDVRLSLLREKGMFVNKTAHKREQCPFGGLSKVKAMSRDEIAEHLVNGACPFVSSKKQRTYGEVADVIVFDDSVYYRGW